MSDADSDHEGFSVGDRVRLSEAGLKRKGSRGGGYQGCVIGVRGGSIPTVKVVFDGNKGPTTLHAKYLVLDRDC
jgi:hypothetical protein